MTERDAAAQKTREKILKSATELFAQRGLEGVPLRDVAKKAGVPLSTLAHHFSPKEKLQEAVIYYVMDMVTAHNLSMKLSGSPREQLRSYIRQLVDLQLSGTAEIRLLDREFHSLNDDMIASMILQSFQDNPSTTAHLAELFRSTGSKALESIAPFRLACILFSLIFGLIKLRPIHRTDPQAPLADAAAIAAEVTFIFEKVLDLD